MKARWRLTKKSNYMHFWNLFAGSLVVAKIIAKRLEGKNHWYCDLYLFHGGSKVTPFEGTEEKAKEKLLRYAVAILKREYLTAMHKYDAVRNFSDKVKLKSHGPYQHEMEAYSAVLEARRKGKKPPTMEQAYNDACYPEPKKRKPRAKRGKGGGHD